MSAALLLGSKTHPRLTSSARIEIDAATLTRLLSAQHLCACELRCLDTDSKQLLRRLCLDTCLARSRSNSGSN